jgi:hypothetical protein
MGPGVMSAGIKASGMMSGGLKMRAGMEQDARRHETITTYSATERKLP